MTVKFKVAKGFCSRLIGVVYDRWPGGHSLQFGWGRKSRLVFEWR